MTRTMENFNASFQLIITWQKTNRISFPISHKLCNFCKRKESLIKRVGKKSSSWEIRQLRKRKKTTFNHFDPSSVHILFYQHDDYTLYLNKEEWQKKWKLQSNPLSFIIHHHKWNFFLCWFERCSTRLQLVSRLYS